MTPGHYTVAEVVCAVLTGWALGAGNPAAAVAPVVTLVALLLLHRTILEELPDPEVHAYAIDLLGELLDEHGPADPDPEGCYCTACTAARFLSHHG